MLFPLSESRKPVHFKAHKSRSSVVITAPNVTTTSTLVAANNIQPLS